MIVRTSPRGRYLQAVQSFTEGTDQAGAVLEATHGALAVSHLSSGIDPCLWGSQTRAGHSSRAAGAVVQA